MDRGDAPETAPLYRRIAWMVGLWAASVAVLGAVAAAIRWVLS